MFNRKTTRTVVVDGQTIEVSDAGAAAIERLQQRVSDVEGINRHFRATQATAIDAKDADIARLRSEVQQLKDTSRRQAAEFKPSITDATFAQHVRERVALEAAAKAICDDGYDYSNLTDDEVRRSVVISKRGKNCVPDATPAEIAGIFKLLVADSRKPDVVAQALRDAVPRVADNGWSESVAALDYRTRNPEI